MKNHQRIFKEECLNNKMGKKRGISLRKEGIFNNKRGQLTIFIILAALIVIVGVLAFMFFPQIQTGFGIISNNPNVFIQNCMEDKVKETVSMISLQGGSVNPQNYIPYEDEKIEYLCYTSEFYIPCVMQQPLLKQHIESEIKNEIKQESSECLNSLKKSFESQGYDVELKIKDTKVEILPNRISVTFENDLTLRKEEAERYDELKVNLNNNLYELVSIANSIISMEVRYGDSETTTYMNYYHDLKVEKHKQTEGSTIYILTERDNGNKFQFASRSIAWPAGI
tara:strand:+ start:644 stop:1489 length:846 start_codon:yes stop_codon:yes gene_type:complete